MGPWKVDIWALVVPVILGIVQSETASACHQNDTNCPKGLVLSYDFKEGGGTAVGDKMSDPMNLVLTDDPEHSVNPSDIQWGTDNGGFIRIAGPTLLRSGNPPQPASKFYNSCRNSNALTIMAWIKPANLTQEGPARIFTISRDSGNRLVTLAQDKKKYVFRLRNTVAGLNGTNPQTITPNNTVKTEVQRVTARWDGTTAQIFVGDTVVAQEVMVGASFANWEDKDGETYAGAIGNELDNGDQPLTQRDWQGDIYNIGVWCRALLDEEIKGGIIPEPEKMTYNVNESSQDLYYQQWAYRLFYKLTGTKKALGSTTITQMADLLKVGKTVEAAKIATSDPNFINIRVRNTLAPMTERNNASQVALNDALATMIYYVENNLDFREVLTTSSVARVKSSVFETPSDTTSDMLLSNNHYEAVDNNSINLSGLFYLEEQKLLKGDGTVISHPDPAGVLTSRQNMMNHGVAGTNRRLAEYALTDFLCTELTEVKDLKAPQAMLRRDVTHAPGGDPTVFNTHCLGCHAALDGLAAAFNFFDYSNDRVKMVGYYQEGDGEDEILLASNKKVVEKANKNEEFFPLGYEASDDSAQNYFNGLANQAHFQWDPTTYPFKGVGGFGQLVSKAGAFKSCMAERVYQSVCGQEASSSVKKHLSKVFSTSGYDLEEVFVEASRVPACIGVGS